MIISNTKEMAHLNNIYIYIYIYIHTHTHTHTYINTEIRLQRKNVNNINKLREKKGRENINYFMRTRLSKKRI